MSAAKNKAFAVHPPFIWGVAVGEEGFLPDDYLTHTRYPRFICRVVHDGYDPETENTPVPQGEIGVAGEAKRIAYRNPIGLYFTDFAFIEPPPPENDLRSVCDMAVANYIMRDDEQGLSDGTYLKRLIEED